MPLMKSTSPKAFKQNVKNEKDPYLSFNSPSIYIKTGLNPMLIGSTKNNTAVSLKLSKILE